LSQHFASFTREFDEVGVPRSEGPSRIEEQAVHAPVELATTDELRAQQAFRDIVHDSDTMKRVVARARAVASRSLPVLLEGESGTGKELFARAIHQASPRRFRAFQAVNCGALSSTLIASTLFGHERGAFTGAQARTRGAFEAADGGTLFLDEVGEFPLAMQAKLLRVLQEGEIVRVGATRPVPVDVRIIAATNRILSAEVCAGRFREDLYYRLAVAPIRVPALRERKGDLPLLMDALLDRVNRESRDEVAGFQRKHLCESAREIVLDHDWPGNVRELLNTLRRAAVWSTAPSIAADDLREALLPRPPDPVTPVLGRPLGNDFDIRELLADVASAYLSRAMRQAGNNKSQAARLVGLPSYQTLSNWLQKYGVET